METHVYPGKVDCQLSSKTKVNLGFGTGGLQNLEFWDDDGSFLVFGKQQQFMAMAIEILEKVIREQSPADICRTLGPLVHTAQMCAMYRLEEDGKPQHTLPVWLRNDGGCHD